MTDAESQFRALSQAIFDGLSEEEILLLNLCGEDSDFVRFNQGRIRSAGNVHQLYLSMDLIRGARAATASIQLCGQKQADVELAAGTIERLRALMPHLPDDPFLNFAIQPFDSVYHSGNALPSAFEAAENLIEAAAGQDLVGSLACGEMIFGFANSLGQFNWHSDYNFLADWSLHGGEEAAVKQSYEGLRWEGDFVSAKIAYGLDRLELLKRKPKVLSPGRFRVFLEPTAMSELLRVIGMDGFGLKDHRTRQTSLLRLSRGDLSLSSEVNMFEDHAGGRTPCFNQAGFIKPDRVDLIKEGVFQDRLASPRSARQYGEAVNSAHEHPESLAMTGGALHQNEVLEALGTGIYIGNLWYCNLSDRSHCRVTGLTRFASFWVENGEAVAPINVMRFDESLYHILGEGLLALTREREHIYDTTTYERRSEASTNLPGALVDNFTLTL